MQKRTKYRRVVFGADVLQEALETVEKLLDGADAVGGTLTTSRGDSEWEFDDVHEFFGDYRLKHHHSVLYRQWHLHKDPSWVIYSLDVRRNGLDTTVSIQLPERNHIHRVSDVFDRRVEEFTIAPAALPAPAPPPQPRIFVGHGGSGQWRDLKDHLHEVHGYAVEAYEVGARAGHVVRDILEEMLTKSSFAVLVMTAEDDMADGRRRARQNVIHETGLFQGKLGFSRAIVLVEEGADDYSNLNGVQMLRYSKGNIKEVFGDVLGVLRREFGTI